MSRPSDSSRRLQEAVDLLLMVEVMCQNANGGRASDALTPVSRVEASRVTPREQAAQDMPWTGIQLVLRESRKRIEDVLKNGAQSDRPTANGQSAPVGNRPLSSRIQRTPASAEPRNPAAERNPGQIREIDPGFLLEGEDFEGDELIR